ncbi:hypothetical protein [Ideonella livida]|uniref:Polysaccharide pyruvyl transferase domain-containing protein n=1 Tax=Ideonella livida TaxID=2707176 RepID=A0A7C9PH94_9BURK|nr:hypothetical protein [Ideonella livida]NDY91937.1 hypothetical protein [Ideonella livida]
MNLPLSLTQPFDELASRLKAMAGDDPIYYFPNPGNWGDGLIRAGALSFFDQYGIKVEEHFTRREFMVKPKKGLMIYGGSGAWCTYWNHAVEHVKALQTKHRVVVLPSTFESTYEVPGVVFHVRDRFESQQFMPEAHFCHDMAFALAGRVGPMIEGKGDGYFFRNDKERSQARGPLPVGNLDLSNKGKHDTDVAPFFEHLSRYAVVHTDRLHVAIGAAMLGKSVHLYPSAYFKIRAIFKSSVEPHFENVTLHDSLVKLPSGR